MPAGTRGSEVNRQTICVLLFLCGPLFAAPSDAEGERGTVTGQVLNEQNQAVVAALVEVRPFGRVILGMILPSAKTDENGYFSISNLTFNSYLVQASKVQDGYPEGGYSFYSDDRFEVNLSAEHPKVNAAVKIGPRAGVLKGAVYDASLGAPVRPSFHLWHMSEPNRLQPHRWLDMSAGSPFRLLIPANTNVGVEVSAKGYEPWYYPGSSSPSELQPLNLKSGEERTIDIRLQRAEPER